MEAAAVDPLYVIRARCIERTAYKVQRPFVQLGCSRLEASSIQVLGAGATNADMGLLDRAQ